MQILVTGIQGAIAPFVAQHFEEKGDRVIGAVRNSGARPSIGESVVCDVRQLASVKAAITQSDPDIIIHLAAVSTLRESWNNPLAMLQTNLLGTVHFLEALRTGKQGIRLIIVGSREVYGQVKKKELPITEAQPFNPLNPYGVAKGAADMLAQQYATKFDVDVIATRPFNHTAPVWPERFVDSNWCKQIALIEAGKQSPIIQVGDLSGIRDFVDCRDAAAAYDALASKGKKGAAYNICSGAPVSMREILDELIGLAKVPIKVQRDPTRVFPDQVKEAWGSNEKIRKDTNWKPGHNLQETRKALLDNWRQKV